jgi:hypothetical protein
MAIFALLVSDTSMTIAAIIIPGLLKHSPCGKTTVFLDLKILHKVLNNFFGCLRGHFVHGYFSSMCSSHLDRESTDRCFCTPAMELQQTMCIEMILIYHYEILPTLRAPVS